jgi:hypothetical protein
MKNRYTTFGKAVEAQHDSLAAQRRQQKKQAIPCEVCGRGPAVAYYGGGQVCETCRKNIKSWRHGSDVCSKYNEPVLPDEDGDCSLCGAVLDDSYEK